MGLNYNLAKIVIEKCRWLMMENVLEKCCGYIFYQDSSPLYYVVYTFRQIKQT